MKQGKRRPETAAVRGASDLEKRNGPVAPEIYQTSTFEVTDNEEQIRVTTTDRYYTRWGNPTITLAEQTVAALEGTEAALVFASGMGAITTTILALLKAGDHIVAQRDLATCNAPDLRRGKIGAQQSDAEPLEGTCGYWRHLERYHAGQGDERRWHRQVGVWLLDGRDLQGQGHDLLDRQQHHQVNGHRPFPYAEYDSQ